MSFLSDAFKFIAAPVTLGLDLLGSLIPLPKVPEGLKQQGQAYVAELQNNRNRLGDVKPVVLGKAKVWFALAAEPYVRYIDHDQYYHAYLHATVGPAEITELCIGERPLDLIPGTQSEILQPGDTLGLVHPKVWTSPDVAGIELPGGGNSALNASVTDKFSFRANGQIIGRNESLSFATLGSTLTVSGTGVNDGAYTVIDNEFALGVGGRSRTYLTTVDHAFTPADNVTATLDFVTAGLEGDALLAENVPLTLTASPPTITGPDGAFATALVGDRIAVLGSELNRTTPFEVTATDLNRTLTVGPAPVGETLASASVQLLKRQSGEILAAPRGETTQLSEVDIFFDRGLGDINTKKGSVGNYTVDVLIEWRAVDDADQPLSGWTSQTERFTDKVVGQARRYTRVVRYPSAIRPQIRVSKLTSDANAGSDIYSACTWAGLRSYLEPRAGEEFGTDPLSTRVAVLIRSSGVLNAIQQRTLNGQVQIQVPTYTAGVAGPAVATRNPYWLFVWWLIQFGKGRITPASFDWPTIEARAADADAAGVEFNAHIDAEVLLWENAQAILRVDRAYPLLDPVSRLITVARDEPNEPALLLGDWVNCELGAPAIESSNTDQPTGVRVNFTDPATWIQRDDGPVIGNPLRLQEIDFFGCTSWDAAYREAVYQRRVQLYRTLRVDADTEMLGQLARVRRHVLAASARYGWGWAGEVVSEAGLTLRLSQAPEWVSGASHYIRLERPDGTPTAQISITRGSSDDEAVLATAHGTTLRTGSGRRTVYVIGRLALGAAAACEPRKLIVDAVQANGLYAASLSLVNDDARVYADIGPIPPDPRAPTGTVPALVIDGLTTSVTA